MAHPRFSIIVATRERSDTLYHCLRTLVKQDFDDYEIVVSDNNSQDDTQSVVESFESSRIKYFNTDKRVGMSQNWEFGLGKATGEFITYVGDDDGLLPSCLGRVDNILRSHNASAVVWQKALYQWPALGNWLRVPLAGNIKRVSCPEALRECLHSRNSKKSFNYSRLPCIYSGAISRKSIEAASVKGNGNFFQSKIPDVYSGIALALTTKDFLWSERPLSVNGASAHSTGSSIFGVKGTSQKPDQRFAEEENIPFHEECSFAASIPILFYESLLQVRDHLMVDLDSYSIDLEWLFKSAWKRASGMSFERKMLVAEAINTMASEKGAHFRVEPPSRSDCPSMDGSLKRRTSIGIRPLSMILDGDEMNLENIFDACILSEHVSSLWNCKSGVMMSTLRRGLQKMTNKF